MVEDYFFFLFLNKLLKFIVSRTLGVIFKVVICKIVSDSGPAKSDDNSKHGEVIVGELEAEEWKHYYQVYVKIEYHILIDSLAHLSTAVISLVVDKNEVVLVDLIFD